MLDVKNPEIDVDEIMQRIEEQVRSRRKHTAPLQLQVDLASSSMRLQQLLSRARDTATVGQAIPPMSRTRGISRAIATFVAKAFLRLAQLITRDQRTFNQSILDALQLSVETETRDVERLRAEQATRFSELEKRFNDLDAQVRASLEQVSTTQANLQSVLVIQERRLTSFLEEAGRRLPEPFDDRQLRTFADDLPHVADPAYLHFEDAFRGSREEIRRRVRVYVPKLKEAGAGSQQSEILDLGCGRGELIEVLREEGLKARGVDSNSAAVELCRALQLDVKLGDVFQSLREVPDGSIGALTALHLVEHLPYPLVRALLSEAVRVLRPGGLLILETPNPLNVLVGASNFYVDPTHRNPVHPQTLRYLCEAHGLARVETLMLHPYGADIRISEQSEVARRFNDYFYGPQDYAVLGRRP